jgi:hypothetical protein
VGAGGVRSAGFGLRIADWGLAIWRLVLGIGGFGWWGLGPRLRGNDNAGMGDGGGCSGDSPEFGRIRRKAVDRRGRREVLRA